MSNSIAYIQAVVGMAAAENTSGKMEAGTAKVETGEKNRRALEKEMERRQKEIEKLNSEMAEINDRSDFSVWWDNLWGSDGGRGEVQDKLSKQAAAMKKAGQELRVEQAKIEMALQEATDAMNDLEKRSNERQQAYDDSAKNIQFIA